ncbi:hypothetical protein B7P43_G04094 [Cryptotermes secundus]|uniref:Uncharacterized protein n=1 Tax=Cryptotermes secundus TaxID=105785 RepID=A0A2J7R3Z6_9NEOP|nr:hypothetical protein B7P43_G04094 [Cryptotermes secundus]
MKQSPYGHSLFSTFHATMGFRGHNLTLHSDRYYITCWAMCLILIRGVNNSDTK